MTIKIQGHNVEFTMLEAEIITHLMRDTSNIRKALVQVYELLSGMSEQSPDTLDVGMMSELGYGAIEKACNELIPYIEGNALPEISDAQISLDNGLHYWIFRIAIERSSYIRSEVENHPTGYIPNTRLLELLDAAQRIERLTGYTLPLK